MEKFAPDPEGHVHRDRHVPVARFNFAFWKRILDVSDEMNRLSRENIIHLLLSMANFPYFAHIFIYKRQLQLH